MTHVAAHASRPKPGETANGDRAFVIVAASRLVAGVVDGLGHGPLAEEAALRAVATVEAQVDATIDELFEGTHRALRGSRGAALTIVVVEGDELRAAGVGNVALRVLRGSNVAYVATPGIVGGQMRGIRVARASVRLPTRIVVHSDGISHRFPSAPYESGTLDEVSARVLAEHAGSHDDATVLVLDLTPGGLPRVVPPTPMR